MEEEHCFNNWDLNAVVRLGCRRRLSPPPLQVNDPFDSLPLPPPPPQHGAPAAQNPAPEAANKQEVDAGWRFPDLRAGGGHGCNELLMAYLAVKPAMPPPPPTLLAPPPLPTLPAPPPPPQQQPVVVTPAEVQSPASATPLISAPARAQPSGRQMPGSVARSKRRKNQVKKVVRRVPADSISSDAWAWRKYGQKPIKGSPYPRGYYRCSSSKGCGARKQVERCRTDPNIFILTYTGEHNHAAPTHRNSLAGTTRHKFPSTASPPLPSVVVGSSESQQQQQPSPGPLSTSAGLSPTTPLRTPSMEEDDEEEMDELLVEDMEMAGEDELLFLNGDADSAAPLDDMSSLFDVDESFLGSPWEWDTPTAGSPSAGASGSGAH